MVLKGIQDSETGYPHKQKIERTAKESRNTDTSVGTHIVKRN